LKIYLVPLASSGRSKGYNTITTRVFHVLLKNPSLSEGDVSISHLVKCVTVAWWLTQENLENDHALIKTGRKRKSLHHISSHSGEGCRSSGPTSIARMQ
jgi:hypothetical protein